MDWKQALEDVFDLRPIPKATLYAAGTGLEGIALGLFFSVVVPDWSPASRLSLAGVLFLAGAILAVSAFSALKRRYRIIEISRENSENGGPPNA